jgi:tetratricopeptide (TPR) repeat protein
MGALDDLLAAWRANPDADATIALCSYLGATRRDDLVKEVANTAETWHSRDVDVMVAVGRMYLDLAMLPEAQASFVTAGKANGQDPRPFRYLGEVLLRRGDAQRSEKVLARAIQLGSSDQETRHWHDRASFYIALQKRVGAQAVADEVGRALPRKVSIPAPAVAPRPFGSEDITNPGFASPLPRFESADEISEVSQIEPIPDPPTRPARARTIIGVAPQGHSSHPPPASQRPPQVVMPSKHAIAARRDSFDHEAVTALSPSPFEAQRAGMRTAAAAVATPLAIAAQPAYPKPALAPVPDPEPPVRAVAPAVARTADAALTPLGAAPARLSPAAPPPTGFVPVSAPPPPLQALQPNEPEREISGPSARHDDRNPAPQVVLEHLARVGIFEPKGSVKPAWETPPRQKSRGIWVLPVAIALVAGSGIGAYFYAKDVREKKMARATELNTDVDRLLKTGKVADLRATDEKLSESFELDSLSQKAARLWLQNRVLRALLLAEESRGIDAAVHRGQTVGLAEKDVVFGRIASFMVEGDLAGAAAVLPRWDKEAGRDPYFHLVAGAVLERAGDLRAVERYEAARTLAPDLAATEILLARLALLEFGKEKGKPVVDSLKSRAGDQPTTRALAALSWVVDPERPESLPDEARLSPEDRKQLPAPLAAVPEMVAAVEAMQKGDHASAAKSLDTAIGLADTPSLAVRLGFLSIDMGDEQLARKAALRALAFSALYPRARILAARVALLGGRLEEAQKAVEQLEPNAPDVAVVRAAVAYESLEPADLESAVSALGDAANDPAFAALRVAAGVLRGTKFPKPDALKSLAEPSVPWGELVALDAALDTGNLMLAEELLGARASEEQRPVHLLRLARLLRYRGKAEEALAASEKALEANMTVGLLLERTYGLLAADKPAEARTVVAKYPSVLGPMTAWLQALIDVAEKHEAQAVARIAKLDLPPDAAPLAIKIMVDRALVAAGDKRAKPYHKALLKQFPKQPDLKGLEL